MDTTMAMAKLEAAVDQAVLLAGGDESIETAARVLLNALEPAVRQLAFDLAEQAAVEVDAQVEGHHVEVVLVGGEPTLQVRSVEAEGATDDALDARITLRLSPKLKSRIEDAAELRGESVNSWLVKTLATRTTGSGRSRRVEGVIET